MALCNVCHGLRVDSTTNLTAEETTRPESHRLRTFSISQTLRDWRQSASGGCATCRLIWQALTRFDTDATLDKLLQALAPSSQPSSSQHGDDDIYLELIGFVGETLMLEFVELPSDTYFPTLEIFSLDDTLPTRVLDVGGNIHTRSISLLETEPGHDAKYVALSYCWGKAGNITTTKSTLGERKKDVAWSVLPKSFQDAIEVVRALGIRYLWIDALCIIQDDTADWERESAKMADVYENAFLTISLDAARDPTQGIFTARRGDRVSTSDTLSTEQTTRPARNLGVEKFSVTDEFGSAHVVYAREPLSHSDIINPRSYYDVTYPLMSRAWTLQERLLSGRILHVTAAELIWECKTTLCCECGTITRESDYYSENPSPKIAYDTTMQNIIEEGRNALDARAQEARQSEGPLTPKTSREWCLLIGGYSNRLLTYETDRLPAISALARRFSLADELPTPRTYLAGLWLEDLPWLLCWRAFQRRFEKRPGDYCAPTWSWASISTPVIWDMETYGARSRVEVLDAAAAPVGRANAFGRVEGAYATLRGPVQRAVLEVDVQHGAVLALRNARGERIFFVPDLSLSGPDNARDISSGPGNPAQSKPEPGSAHQQAASPRVISSTLRDRGDVACLWLLEGDAEDKAYALVLAPAPDDAAVFERAGLVTPMSRVYQRNDVPAARWFIGTEMETVYIV
ncbi:HET-domain-containing protein [Xylaria palmicola]|nr:HET-domain-containing protein [Xylaria palmicola]